MDALAVVLAEPEKIVLDRLPIAQPSTEDVVVEVAWSGVSSGTERLLWSGRMPPFPGMGYPLVPGYESVGRIVEAGPGASVAVGDWVFVPGAQCFGEVRGLFGGAASRLVVPAARVTPIDSHLGEDGVLLALAATARHVLALSDRGAPQLIVGHGVLGRLLARLVLASGAPAPTVWEIAEERLVGADGYRVCRPEEDDGKAYASIVDVSGDSGILDTLIGRLARGGEILMAGFYAERPSFAFPPAFMKEARLKIAAEFTHDDVVAVTRLLAEGRLTLDKLITHRRAASDAAAAYRTAFGDTACLKMVLDWRVS